MRKKSLSLALALVMVLAMLPTAAFAASSEFEIENGVLIKYNGPGGAVTIPDSVTKIGYGSFSNCTSLTSITIPNTVTEIGDCAFQTCTGLTSITIPNSVTKIGECAFRYSTGLTAIQVDSENHNYTSIDGILFNKSKTQLVRYPEGKKGPYNIPNSVISIGAEAFQFCEGLTSVTIPNSVKTIGGTAFLGCTDLATIQVDSENQNFTSIDGVLFNKSKTKLVEHPENRKGSYSIPNSVTEIGEEAFRDCIGLTSVTIPNSVKSIGKHAFDKCSGLTSVTIPSSVTAIGEAAFIGCTGLTSLTIPGSVTVIANHVFSGCNNLTNVIIHDGAKKIEMDAFSSCWHLTSITIPNSITTIEDYAFKSCPNLKDIYYGGSEEQWKKIKINNLYDLNKNLLSATIHYNSPMPTQPTTPAQSAKDVAHASAQTVTVDGKPVEFQMYALKDASGNDTNYIKLRDMACVLNGTKAQFNVGYDQQSGTITAATGTAYEEDGTEMTATFGGADKEYVKTTLTIQLDGKPVQLETITLTDDAGGGYNYCKVRDLGQTFNFNVDWNAGVGIYIESDKPYSG